MFAGRLAWQSTDGICLCFMASMASTGTSQVLTIVSVVACAISSPIQAWLTRLEDLARRRVGLASISRERLRTNHVEHVSTTCPPAFTYLQPQSSSASISAQHSRPAKPYTKKQLSLNPMLRASPGPVCCWWRPFVRLPIRNTAESHSHHFLLVEADALVRQPVNEVYTPSIKSSKRTWQPSA